VTTELSGLEPDADDPSQADPAPTQLSPRSGRAAVDGEPGTAAPTSWTVAREAGVSQSTVSRALRRDPRVRAETRRRVDQAARRLGYVPHSTPGRIASRATRTVAVIVSDLTNPFLPSLLTPIYDELQLMGHRVILLTERTALPTQQTLQRLLDRTFDGVIVTTATVQSSFAGELQERGLPVVLLNRYIDGLDIDRVVSDNYEGAVASGRHLLDLGHRRIAVVRGPANASTSRDRMAGLGRAFSDAGLTLDQALVREGAHTHQTGYQHTRDLLRLDAPPTAIVCANDVVAFGALDAAHSLGVRVPADVSILGFGDIPMASWEVFQLTTVRQPIEDMARAAVHMLDERMQDTADISAGREQVFATSLVRRTTVDRPPGDH
jgi:LacI family transcriptional regulator